MTLLFYFGLLAAPAAAAEPRIRDLSAVPVGGQVTTSFRLEGGFTPELVARIESGLPTGFAYELVLARDRKRWWDDALVRSRLEVIAMFNAVTREYLVNTKVGGRLVDSRTLRDLAELETAMTNFAALPVFPVPLVGAGTRLLVRARVELGTGQLLGFIPFLRTTRWADSNKFRVVGD